MLLSIYHKVIQVNFSAPNTEYCTSEMGPLCANSMDRAPVAMTTYQECHLAAIPALGPHTRSQLTLVNKAPGATGSLAAEGARPASKTLLPFPRQATIVLSRSALTPIAHRCLLHQSPGHLRHQRTVIRCLATDNLTLQPHQVLGVEYVVDALLRTVRRVGRALL